MSQENVEIASDWIDRRGDSQYQVIATDEAGNTDPSAAKDTFRVVD